MMDIDFSRAYPKDSYEEPFIVPSYESFGLLLGCKIIRAHSEQFKYLEQSMCAANWSIPNSNDSHINIKDYTIDVIMKQMYVPFVFDDSYSKSLANIMTLGFLCGRCDVLALHFVPNSRIVDYCVIK